MVSVSRFQRVSWGRVVYCNMGPILRELRVDNSTKMCGANASGGV